MTSPNTFSLVTITESCQAGVRGRPRLWGQWDIFRLTTGVDPTTARRQSDCRDLGQHLGPTARAGVRGKIGGRVSARRTTFAASVNERRSGSVATCTAASYKSLRRA